MKNKKGDGLPSPFLSFPCKYVYLWQSLQAVGPFFMSV